MKFLMSILLVLTLSAVYAADFTNESELGVAVAAGNSQSENYNFKQENKFTFNANLLKFNARYLNAYANNTESARYLLGCLRYERELSDRFSIYAGQMFESDKFSGYDLRHSNDLGFKYFIKKEETLYWSAETGYRYTKETQVSKLHAYRNQLRIYSEAEKKWTPTVSTKLSLEYLPNLDESKDYEIHTEASVSAVISSRFSIKTAYLLRYDRVPPPSATTTTDTLFTTALVAKF